jgi:hypothetical protein
MWTSRGRTDALCGRTFGRAVGFDRFTPVLGAAELDDADTSPDTEEAGVVPVGGKPDEADEGGTIVLVEDDAADPALLHTAHIRQREQTDT